MLRTIVSMTRCGIFPAYSKPADLENFSDRNVIYGWNYSGKTTISRLFAAMEEKIAPKDWPSAQFAIEDTQGRHITEANLATASHRVRVFNSDFIQNSLRWDGNSFNAILLLGKDSIEAEKKVSHFEKVYKRATSAAARKRAQSIAVERSIADGKTQAAKNIKTTLGIVEAFTATHLDKLLATPDLTAKIVDEAEIAELTRVATQSEKDRLPTLAQVEIELRASKLYLDLSKWLMVTPTQSSPIQHLKENPSIEDWVSAGLDIHRDATTCEFCASQLKAERMAQLQSHFSQEYKELVRSVTAIESQLGAAQLQVPDVREAELNAGFREKLGPILKELEAAIGNYNRWTSSLQSVAKDKIRNIYGVPQIPHQPTVVIEQLKTVLLSLNTLISSSNKVGDDFFSTKSAALSTLKHHYAAVFSNEIDLAAKGNERIALNEYAKKYDAVASAASEKILEQKALINRAQNGRERLNERLATILGTSSVQISVTKESGEDRFYLSRANGRAKNLSEGEKTAIAFSYFLTKLEEDGLLSDTIVYIDDPISSLDSNHIFQINSIIRTTFFRWDVNRPGRPGWGLNCKQLFISTHNYEFFALLQDLPGDSNYPVKFFQTKRISPDSSNFTNLAKSILKYSSEYHYLFDVIYTYHQSPDKASIELLLSLPNAMRRFLELYTYSRLPLAGSNVDKRAARLFGAAQAGRIMKVLHYFSHLENIDRMVRQSDLIADVEVAVSEVITHLKQDSAHFEALTQHVHA